MVAWRASGFGGSILKVHLSIDRFEGDKKQIAVLLTDDGTQINFPKKLLPDGAKAGDILCFEIERDLEATSAPSHLNLWVKAFEFHAGVP